MSSEELNKMSKKTPLADSSFENPRPEEEIADDIKWDLDDLKKAIIDNAEMYDELLDKAGQETLPPNTAESLWEMERKLWQQRDGAKLDEHSY